jgi:hypothetical protein
MILLLYLTIIHGLGMPSRITHWDTSFQLQNTKATISRVLTFAQRIASEVQIMEKPARIAENS